MSSPETDWRDDPGWRLVEYDAAIYSEENLPMKPTREAELATQPEWASLYQENKIIATWHRSRATMVVEDGGA